MTLFSSLDMALLRLTTCGICGRCLFDDTGHVLVQFKQIYGWNCCADCAVGLLDDAYRSTEPEEC